MYIHNATKKPEADTTLAGGVGHQTELEFKTKGGDHGIE